MRELILHWYQVLSTLNAAVAEPLSSLADSSGIPLLSALLFGLLGATSPCQLTTNASALAYVARGAGQGPAIARSAVAYLFGKALVYTLLGVAVIVSGQQLAQQSIPVVVAARKTLGPLMLVLGFYLLGLVPLRFSLGHGLADWIEARAGPGAAGPFLLGTAFAFAFCPTLFLLFFGLTLPLALSSPLGVVYPGMFAVGTTLPLLGVAGLLTAGVTATKGYVRQAKRVGAWLRRAAALVLVLAGLNDTITYWLL
jgi:cytochrome c-type biogenesis protein